MRFIRTLYYDGNRVIFLHVFRFFDGPMCEQCQRGYATETCKTKCPGYIGKILSPHVRADFAIWEKMERVNVSVVVEEVRHPPRHQIDTHLPTSTHPMEVAPHRIARFSVRNNVHMRWDVNGHGVVCKTYGWERAVPSPALLPFEPTYFFGQYREYSTFLWPTGNTEAINLVANEDGTRDEDGTIVCRDFQVFGVT